MLMVCIYWYQPAARVWPLALMLAEAREKRDAALKLPASGICPSLSREAEKPATLNTSQPHGTPVVTGVGQKTMRIKFLPA